MKVLNKKGVILGIVIIYMLILTILGYGLLQLSYANAMQTEKAVWSNQAFWLAEAGIQQAFITLRTTPSYWGVNTTLSGSVGPGSYQVPITITFEHIPGQLDKYTIVSTGSFNNQTRIVTLTSRPVSCAGFLFLTNNENGVWYITGDTLTGPVYTNGQLHINGNPVFNAPVSSAASTIDYYHDGPPRDNPTFNSSLNLSAAAAAMPIYTTNAIASEAGRTTYDSNPQHTYSFTGNTVVTLLSNGTMNVTNSDRGLTNYNLPIPSSGALFVSGGYLDISGTLNGQLTAGTDRDIFITNNILYNDDPRTNPDSTDTLGLVSQRNVYVDGGAPDNLEIDAYIVAPNENHSFIVENYDTSHKGTLTVYGGITQHTRGPVGTCNSDGTKRSGYSKNYSYDTRFLNMSPLYFPPAMDQSGAMLLNKESWHEG
jgi:hypothetical protein